MITNKRFIRILGVCSLIYLLPELLFNQAMLYLSGGLIGGTITEIFKDTLESPSVFLVFAIWVALLVGLVFLFFKLNYKPIKFFVLLIIAFFLYIIDNLLVFIPIFGKLEKSTAIIVSYIITVVSVLIKSIILALIYYKGVSSE